MILKEKDLWSEKIPFIKKLKDFYSKIEYKRINLWPIIANECYTYYKSQEDRGFKEIFDGKHDKLPEQAFYMAGTIEEVVRNAK